MDIITSVFKISQGRFWEAYKEEMLINDEQNGL